jgi:hypothetical protein
MAFSPAPRSGISTAVSHISKNTAAMPHGIPRVCAATLPAARTTKLAMVKIRDFTALDILDPDDKRIEKCGSRKRASATR